MPKSKSSITIYTDGGSRGNPGPSAIGGVGYWGIGYPPDRPIPAENEAFQFSDMLEDQETNNVAEYMALVKGLRLANQYCANQVHCRLDSKLVVEQMNRRYEIKSEPLRLLYNEVKLLCKPMVIVTFEHIPRRYNQLADRLVNLALDGKSL